MKSDLENRIKKCIEVVSADKKAAKDFRKLLSVLPPGQIKNLMKHEECAVILREYGIS